MLLQAADQAFDNVALAVGLPVHHEGPGLGPELRDDRGHAAAAEMVAHPLAGIAAIAEQRLGPQAWPATAGALHRTARHQGLEGGLLVTLAGGQEEGDRPAAALAAQVELAAEAMIGSADHPAAKLRPSGDGRGRRAAERLMLLPPLAPAA